MFFSKILRIHLFVLFLCLGFVLLANKHALGEYIYLKDGQIINGTITSETKDHIFVKTRFQNRTINRANIKRILYGERKMELLYIQLVDDSIIKGYLVDQDAIKIYLKDNPTSVDEKTILKSTIKQMSHNEIIPLAPSISLRSGLFIPLNPGKADLDYAPAFFIGSGINMSYIKNTRIFLETGYIKCKSKTHDSQFMQFIPITLYGKYYFPVSIFNIVPKIGLGAVIIDYDNKEDPVQRGTSFNFNAGLAIELSIKQKLFLSIGCDYNMMVERSGAMLHTLTPTAGLSYRF